MEEVASESEGETSPLLVSSKRRQRIESDVSLTDHPVLQSCSATSHNPHQSTSSISSQECSDFALEDEIDKERAKNQRLQRVILASDSSSESGEGMVQKTGTRKVKRLGSRQRSSLGIKGNQYQHSSKALMFDAPSVDMCSLEEAEAVSESCSSHGLDASYSTLPRPKQPQPSRNTRNQTSATRAQAKPSRKQDVKQGFVSKRKKMKSEVISSFCNNQKDSDVTSPLLSPKHGLQNDKTSTVYGQHNQTLASWEKIAFLGGKSTKGPMLFAHEHLQDRLHVQEDWMVKARFIWSQWKKQSREARSVYTATAKRNRMERSPRNRHAGHKFDPGSSQEHTSVSNFIPFSPTSRPVEMTATGTTVQSTYQPSPLPTNTVPPVTQRVTQLASQYFQEHSLPGGMSFRQPSFGNCNMFSCTEMSHAQGIMDTSLSCQSLPSAVSTCPSRSVGLPGDCYDGSVSSFALASSEKDKSIKALLSSTNLKPVYHSTAEAAHVFSGVSSDDPLSKQSVTPTFSLPLSVTRVTPVERTSLVSPSTSIPSLLSQPMLHQSTSKQQYSIAGTRSDVSHHGLQNRPQSLASIGSNIQSTANSYSIATMHFHRSSATVHHKPTTTYSSAGSMTSASVQQAAAFVPTTISSPVDISSSFSPSITNPSSTSASFSPTIPSILASSSKPDVPSTSVGLTKVTDEWRRILLERVKEIGIKKQENKKNKPKSKKKQKQSSGSLSQARMSTGGLYSPFAQSPKMSPTTAFPFFPEVSRTHTFPLSTTTVQSESIPSSNPSNKVSFSINEHKCLVADEPSELHTIVPVGQNIAPPATAIPNSMGTKSISGSPRSTNSSPLLSPSTPVTPIFNSASSAHNYADLERHYWQCLVQLEHLKQYTEMVHQHLKEALHHQQIMLLQSDKYQEFLHKLVPPDLEPRQLDKLNHSTGSLPKYEFGGTFDRPIMKIIS